MAPNLKRSFVNTFTTTERIHHKVRSSRPAMSSPQKALLIGISGVSSSGKTTLARILRDVFPKTFVLHEDDFYKTDTEIPVNNGVVDWDCIESLNMPALEQALTFIRSNGKLPPDLVSKEDLNSVGEFQVDAAEIAKWKDEIHRSLPGDRSMPIAIIEGFLLFSEDMKKVRDLFDVKLFLRTDYKTAKRRREARSGYVTLETFWEDPPGYVDDVVWPNYVKDHAFLFHNGDVEGSINDSLCQKLGIQAMPKSALENMTACVHWAYEMVRSAIGPGV